MSIDFLALVIVCIVLAIVLAAYDRLMRKLRGVKLKQEEIEARAREKAVKIVEEARDKALLILNQAKLESTNNQEGWEKRLEEVAEKQVEVYKEMIQNISKTIEGEAIGEIADFKKVLELQAGGTQRSVGQRIELEYQQAAKQLEEYKAAKMREFDARAEDVVKEFIRIVIGKTLSLEEHQELIKKALEEAKKANVF